MTMFHNMKSFYCFKTFSINRLMRRHNNDPYWALLEEVRNYRGNSPLSGYSISFIHSKFITINIPSIDYHIIYDFIGKDGMAIFYRNKSCDEFNNIILGFYAKENNEHIYCRKGVLLSYYKRSYISNNTNSNIFEKIQLLKMILNIIYQFSLKENHRHWFHMLSIFV